MTNTCFLKRHFFRNHCEYIVAQQKRRYRFPYRSRTEFVRSIAAPLHIPYQPTDQEGAPTITRSTPGTSNAQPVPSPTGITPLPVVNTVGATPGGTLVEEELGLPLRVILENHDQANERGTGPSGTAVFSIDDVPLTSSPTQHAPLKLSPVDSKGLRVDFALSTGVSPPGEDYYRRFATARGESTVFLPIRSTSLTLFQTVYIPDAASPFLIENSSGIQPYLENLSLQSPPVLPRITNIVALVNSPDLSNF